MTNPTQERIDAMIAKAETKYGKDSLEAQSARRVAENLVNVLTHTGSGLSFLDPGAQIWLQNEERSQSAAEGYCEKYCTVDNPNFRPLHMVMGASREAQKVAQDALYRLASWYTSEPDGTGPLGECHGHGYLDPATATVVYSTSRPGERWLLDMPWDDFDRITNKLRFDAHCDFSSPTYSTNIRKHMIGNGDEDCVKQMADHARIHLHCEREGIIKPDPSFHVGQLFPVAFGNQVVFMKFCISHLYSFYRKYAIDWNACEIIEPWENVGNYW